MIQPIYFLTVSGQPLFISTTTTEYEGIRTRVTTGGVTARIDVILGILGLDISDLLQFTAQAGIIGNTIYSFILLLEIFQLFISFEFRIFDCLT